MATPASPVLAVLQFRREAVWGTDLAATKRMPVRLIEPDIGVGAIRSGNMTGTRVRTGIAQGGHRARVTFETDLEYVHGATDPNGILMLTDACMGAATFGTYGPNGGDGSYTVGNPTIHEFRTRNVMNSLAMEFVDGQPGGTTDKCLQVVGAKVEEFEYSFGWSYDGEEHIPKLRVTVVGKTAAGNTTMTPALSSQTADLISTKHCVVADGLVSPATAGYFSVKIRVKNNLYTEGFSSLSSFISEPVPLNFLDCQIEMEGDYDAYTALTNYINQTATAANIQFAFTRPSSTSAFIIKSLAGYAKPVSQKHSIKPGSPARQTIIYEPFKDTVNSAFITQYLSDGDVPDTQG